MKFHYADRVKVLSGFYEGHTGIVGDTSLEKPEKSFCGKLLIVPKRRFAVYFKQIEEKKEIYRAEYSYFTEDELELIND